MCFFKPLVIIAISFAVISILLVVFGVAVFRYALDDMLD